MAARSMGDATHANVQTLLPLHLQMVAGYITGSPDIRWTPQDWALFPAATHVYIDQAFDDTLSAQAHAIVFDVEQGAFDPAQAEAIINANQTPDPTVYVNRSNMYATLASAQKSPKFKGAVWLAFPGWLAGEPLPSLPAGCRYVAIQYQLGGPYDLSLVLDPAWPTGGKSVNNVIVIPGVPGAWIAVWYFVPNSIVIGQGTDGLPFVAKFAAGKWGPVTHI